MYHSDKEAESVSKTLEYAYDDYCIAQAAKKLGKEDDYHYFLNRALSYQTLIDPETKYMRGRDSKGDWRTPFTPVACRVQDRYMAGVISRKDSRCNIPGMCRKMCRDISTRPVRNCSANAWMSFLR